MTLEARSAGMEVMKAYEAIAQSLVAEGVTDFFGLMGDGNMWLWGALCRDAKIKAYSARHESMAVSMADGYARTTGKVGLAMVTCGPGLTQCGTSLIAAFRMRKRQSHRRGVVRLPTTRSARISLRNTPNIIQHAWSHPKEGRIPKMDVL